MHRLMKYMHLLMFGLRRKLSIAYKQLCLSVCINTDFCLTLNRCLYDVGCNGSSIPNLDKFSVIFVLYYRYVLEVACVSII